VIDLFLHLSILLLFILSIFVNTCVESLVITAKAKFDGKLAHTIDTQKKTIGAWVPSQLHLEAIENSERQLNVIRTLLAEGFNEYFLIMRDFNNISSVNRTENLLDSTDHTDMKIMVILLPPSEAGSNGNFDWKGWVGYFNSLKKLHRSFDGFAIDDFNANFQESGSFRNNVDYFSSSNLRTALYHKSPSVSFYPVIYIQTGSINLVKREYGKFVSGIILSSVTPDRITNIEENIKKISMLFNKRPVKFLLYPSVASGQNLSYTVIDAILSISSRIADGIIIYVDTSNPDIQNYLHNRFDTAYKAILDRMEKIRLKQEMDINLKIRRDIFVCTTCLSGKLLSPRNIYK
jgi:hypothetical protein